MGIHFLDSYLIHLSKLNDCQNLNPPLDKLNQRSRNENKSNATLLKNSKLNESKGRKFGDDISDITNHQGECKSFGKLENMKTNPKLPQIRSSLTNLSASDILWLSAFASLNLAVKNEESPHYKINDLKRFWNTEFTIDQILEVESMIIEALDWNLNLPSCSELVKYLLIWWNPDYDFSFLISKWQEFTDFWLLDTNFLNYGITDIWFASIIYSCECFQWNDFLYQWKEIIVDTYGPLFANINKTSLEISTFSLFDKALELKDKVLEIIHASNSVKEDIISLRQSITQLSSLVQSYARLSVVKGISIAKEEEGSSSIDDYLSLQVSSECSHNEVTLRNNICKLKRDISRTIMNNPTLLKIVNHYPWNKASNLDEAFRISSNNSSIKSSFALAMLKNRVPQWNIGDFMSDEALNRIESNISSLIPSSENTSIFDEGKNSIWFPKFNKENWLKTKINQNNNPESIKDRLNFDIERHYFLQNLSNKNTENKYFWYNPGVDTKELEIKSVETARFGKNKSNKEASMLSYSSHVSHTYADKPPSKRSTKYIKKKSCAEISDTLEEKSIYSISDSK